MIKKIYLTVKAVLVLVVPFVNWDNFIWELKCIWGK